jgi:hypothetical protein
MIIDNGELTKTAYDLAKADDFKNSSDFYWLKAEQQILSEKAKKYSQWIVRFEFIHCDIYYHYYKMFRDLRQI